MDALSIAVFLSVVNNTIVDYILKPIKENFPNLSTWWMVYVSLLTGMGLGWVSQVNLFVAYLPDVTVGRVLTAVVIGGGSNLIYRLFSRNTEIVVNNVVK